MNDLGLLDNLIAHSMVVWFYLYLHMLRLLCCVDAHLLYACTFFYHLVFKCLVGAASGTLLYIKHNIFLSLCITNDEQHPL